MLLVSIHDVSPAQAEAVQRLWDLCMSYSVIPALLVVPNWHGQWPLEEHSDFVLWLHGRAEEGAEIALHGERHDETGLPRQNKDRWRAIGKTKGEAEFLTLDASAAGERIARGLQRLRQLGLEPTGFVAPAWLAKADTYRIAAEAGLTFSEDDESVRLLSLNRRIRSPVVRWSARTSARAWGSVAVARARWLLQRNTSCPRIAFHPGDLQHPAVSASLGPTLSRWVGRHAPGRYADLIRPETPA
jgi:uncharacterized protein